MALPASRQSIPPRATVAVIGAALLVFCAIGAYRVVRVYRATDPPVVSRPPLRVPLWVEPAQVKNRSRLHFTFDPVAALAPLREEEELDAVVAGAASDEEALLRLMTWVRAQFEPGRPDPYPPPDARIILRDIRDGVTGGFCAQYCFVFVQAAGSFGFRVRMVTIRGHEVAEGWLESQRRWTMFDPYYSLQVLGEDGRSRSALEIRRATESGETLRLSPGHSYPEAESDYLSRFQTLAFWLRNDLVSDQMNFTDFDRYRVWFEPPAGTPVPPGALVTDWPPDVYPPAS